MQRYSKLYQYGIIKRLLIFCRELLAKPRQDLTCVSPTLLTAPQLNGSVISGAAPAPFLFDL